MKSLSLIRISVGILGGGFLSEYIRAYLLISRILFPHLRFINVLYIL